MKHFSYFCILIGMMTCLASCAKEILETSPADEAVRYYKYLSVGEVDAYLDGIYGGCEMAPEFKQQTREVVKDYATKMTDNFGGIDSIRVEDSDVNKEKTLANVILRLYFGNGTNEKVLVPMVKADNKWYIK